jgi:hypothetical protein
MTSYWVLASVVICNVNSLDVNSRALFDFKITLTSVQLQNFWGLHYISLDLVRLLARFVESNQVGVPDKSVGSRVWLAFQYCFSVRVRVKEDKLQVMVVSPLIESHPEQALWARYKWEAYRLADNFGIALENATRTGSFTKLHSTHTHTTLYIWHWTFRSKQETTLQ